ncbi:hypothetical protein [Microlunatus soli]|uniref:hypothetical protein n=1 Tax=Microlunatus soli TaxID=630515 RepID=UPI000B84DB90|nr:hypothetical protein [Microlunatus soli]
MRYQAEVVAAARRVVGGDDSTNAAADLERSIHSNHPSSEELDDLLEALALYQPLAGAPYLNHHELVEAIRNSGVLD